jgi:hypothetical protein
MHVFMQSESLIKKCDDFLVTIKSLIKSNIA